MKSYQAYLFDFDYTLATYTLLYKVKSYEILPSLFI